jgi:hypothetical protein
MDSFNIHKEEQTKKHLMHGGPYPHPECQLAFVEIKDSILNEIKIHLKETIKEIINTVNKDNSQVVSEIEKVQKDFYGNGNEGIKETVITIKKELNELVDWKNQQMQNHEKIRNSLIGAFALNFIFMLIITFSSIVAYVRLSDHVSNQEIHTRIYCTVNEPFTIMGKTAGGEKAVAMTIIPSALSKDAKPLPGMEGK